MKALEVVLADWAERAGAADYLGHARDAELIRRILADVREAARDFLTWLSESEASMRSGWSVRRLRARFSDWEHQGHARKQGRERQYRAIIVPRRADPVAAYQAGLKAASERAA